jgi:hypothetical protein
MWRDEWRDDDMDIMLSNYACLSDINDTGTFANRWSAPNAELETCLTGTPANYGRTCSASRGDSLWSRGHDACSPRPVLRRGQVSQIDSPTSTTSAIFSYVRLNAVQGHSSQSFLLAV